MFGAFAKAHFVEESFANWILLLPAAACFPPISAILASSSPSELSCWCQNEHCHFWNFVSFSTIIPFSYNMYSSCVPSVNLILCQITMKIPQFYGIFRLPLVAKILCSFGSPLSPYWRLLATWSVFCGRSVNNKLRWVILSSCCSGIVV